MEKCIKNKENIKKANNHYVWLDLLKILACFLVIVNHSVSYLLDSSGYNNYSVLVYSCAFAICKIGVPIFLMITGILLNKQMNYRYIGKKIFRIIVPLVLLSAYIYIRNYGIHFNFFKSILEDPISIPHWYLYMLIGLYLMMPLVEKMIRNFDKDVIQSLTPIHISDYLLLAILPYPIAYCIAGIYLTKVELTKRNRNIAIICFMIPLLIFILSLYIPYIKYQEISHALDACRNITTSLPAMAAFYLFRYYFEDNHFSAFTSKWIKEIALSTFGIYLFHFIFIPKIYRLTMIQNIFAFSSFIGIFTFQICLFICCGIITYCLRKIPVLKNFL